MGSQAAYNALHEAPAAIVVRFDGIYFVAEAHDAWQPDRTGGGVGPVVVTYRTIGHPYAVADAAQRTAAMILKAKGDDK